ncbi:MAG TPA: membrane protein insertion efficiency factor YidD [Candidatus Paceibacterota bacterium]|nr:membrane protein insertion efficiency factor YidD [Candidatus Paceibacterota bacterium]
MRIVNSAAIFLIHIYQAIFSPATGILRFIPFYPKPSCIFYPTCSEYAVLAFRKYGFLKAFFISTKRIMRCHPGNEPKIDYP